VGPGAARRAGPLGALSYLLDSTVIIDYANGRPDGVRIIEDLFARAGELYTCDAITCEVLSGGDPDGRVAIVALLDALEFVALDPEGARWAGERRAERVDGGSRRHLGDALVAAVAWRTGSTIVTRDARDFEAYGVPVLAYG
jgi:predicted nucleic acid-binding protein